jgi:hypothetical protein
MSHYSIISIHFDLSNSDLYITSWFGKSICVYHTNDEISFYLTANISTLYHSISIGINNNKIYSGSENNAIFVYNKTTYTLERNMTTMCSYNVWSVRFDFKGNMIYSCFYPPIVRIIGTNGINSTLLLNDSFPHVYVVYCDSKNRLWIGGNNSFVVYN